MHGRLGRFRVATFSVVGFLMSGKEAESGDEPNESRAAAARGGLSPSTGGADEEQRTHAGAEPGAGEPSVRKRGAPGHRDTIPDLVSDARARTRRRWLMAAGGWWVVMFTLTHWPKLGEGSGLHLGIPHADKIAHFALYCAWFLLFAWALRRAGWSRVRTTATLLTVGTVYAAIDESTQAFVPGRTPSMTDFVADVLGLVVGWGIFIGARRIRYGDFKPMRDGV